LEKLEKLIKQMESENNTMPLSKRFELKKKFALKFCKFLPSLDGQTKRFNLLRKKAIIAFCNFSDGLFIFKME
jgi:hypothetical protein